MLISGFHVPVSSPACLSDEEPTLAGSQSLPYPTFSGHIPGNPAIILLSFTSHSLSHHGDNGFPSSTFSGEEL